MYQKMTYSNDFPTLGDLVSSGIPVFTDWWDTFIPEHKKELERKIIHSYYFNQIGAETPERFVWYLNNHLERIMPYYNQLYESELIKINPLLNHSIKHEGRSIQNLLTKANTSGDKFAKSIRDFVGMTDTAGQATRDSTSDTVGTRDGTSTTTYEKHGTEHTDDINDENRNLNGEVKTIENTTKDTTQNTHDTITETGTINTEKDVTENPGQVTTKVMDWGQTETGTKKTVGNSTSDGSGTKNWTETKDDDATTDTTTHLKETTTGSGEKDYADTPQKALEVDGELGTSAIRRDYLTNVTWTNDNSTHAADTTQNQVFADDETKTHKEDTTDNNKTDTTEDVDTTTEKGGSDTETSTLSGQNKTHTDQTETRNLNTNKTGDLTGKEVTKRDQTTTTSETEHTKDDRDIDKTWDENGESTTTTHEDTTSKTTGNIKDVNTQNQQTRENANVSQSSSSMQEKTSEETTDKGDTDITSGFMNVSTSQLLNAFRDTFLNIDEMIIRELRDNFMMVY